jgi:hypothetical protein
MPEEMYAEIKALAVAEYRSAHMMTLRLLDDALQARRQATSGSWSSSSDTLTAPELQVPRASSPADAR